MVYNEVGRSPCGERGLKYACRLACLDELLSLPVRGAWIEMRAEAQAEFPGTVAPRAGSVD